MLSAFVILHYIAVKDTEECIASILKKIDSSKNPFEIVVVDNGSPEKLEDVIDKKLLKENVHIVTSKSNLGFACGNNLGIQYAREHFATRFIICINNDTLICQNDFLEKIDIEYRKSKFWVLGPMIYTADGRYSSNPVHVGRETSLQSIDATIRNMKKQLTYDKYHLKPLQQCWQKIKNKSSKEKKSDNYIYLERKINVVLHGSCLIFSELFFEKYEGFNSETFLYEEEDILYEEVRKEHGIMVYNPEIRIFHKEDVSTNSQFPNNRRKRMFMLENEIKSLEVLRKIKE